ncbi:hypothetical protein PSU4_07370 [Pseudonocardia sulfidoxydans NBRC 16205]|uniref:SMP-30/Gluconolactonase/LRE-like region domain-containing protein n=1 Tax=Pseudonocardia sulfidoxydans NBRC 16205 TaxID=1223511 RepID=A0A511DBK9_9PSEU|nr:SMP-30/gluconolactonase/LRE family protein [Pseudonocardia sulfidoxydans]GEL21783.1 hypothetical protein PSU4_07370 [Pseudonocardia sulfidoxydans NBRC 16205]
MTTTGGRVLVDDLRWAESPRFRDGVVWVSDTQGSRLIEIRPEGTRVHQLDTAVNGTGFLPSGELVAARMHAARVDRFDGERWAPHADLTGLVTGRLGDLIVLPDGTVYVDEVHSPDLPGRLLRIDPEGRASVVAEDLMFPNGLVLLDDGATLLVAETFAGRITAFSVDADGGVSDRRTWFDLWAELGKPFRPDGACGLPDGSAWVAATDGNAFLRLRDGVLVDRIDVDGFAIACWPGADGELLLTTATSLDPAVPVMEAAHQQGTRARAVAVRPSTFDDEG